MAPLELEGNNLGQKHKHFNKLVYNAVSKQKTKLLLTDNDDIQNLMTIDVACKTRNVEFLQEVFKSEDLLYVSRAIKNSKWFVTGNEYSHIVNPDYLHTKLYPEMTTKAFNKLLLSVRLNLKDEERVQGFYKYMSSRNVAASYKWLQNCSITFIEHELKTIGDNIPFHILRRLVERSLSVFKMYMNSDFYIKYRLAKESIFLANYDTEMYLDALETINGERLGIKFNPKATALFMTKCPNRILKKFEFYAGSLHLPTFVKKLREHEDIEKFLLKHAKNEKMKWFYTYHYIEPFVKQMPEDTKFKFVKKIFIDKEFPEKQDDISLDDCGNTCRGGPAVAYCASKSNRNNQNIYQWYKLAPFDIAFAELKKSIRLETTPAVRLTILQVLLSCAGRNMTHIRSVLKYFHQKHNNEPFKFKIQFVNTFISKHDTYDFDDETWEMLNQVYQSLEVYIASENNVQLCIKSILVHHVIRGEKVPDIINSKFVFDNMKEYQYKLKKQEQKDALFSYLYDFLVAKNEKQNSNNITEMETAIAVCRDLLNLLMDWKKDVQSYPYVLEKIKYLNKVKLENSWDTSLISLYDVNNTWKKNLFEESLLLSPTPEVCLNALKHDPGLLVRHKAEVDDILINDNMLLMYLLRKVRIYWSNSLAEEWKTLYHKCLEESKGHKAIAIGLCTLLNRNQLKELAEKYAPSESKIDWHDINEQVFNLQRQIAKTMSKARPLCQLENVLLYAKGDYLQFAVPSINSILSHLSANKLRIFVPRLLDAPISLQKFGVRYAFKKLDTQELKLIFNQIWNTTKNSTMRTVLFTQTHALLCKEKNTDNTNDVWELFSSCIDNLSAEENKLIYETLSKQLGDGHKMRYKYYMKSYTFLKSLPAKADCHMMVRDMEHEAINIMEFLDNDFVANVMFNDLNEKITTEDLANSRTIAAYILCCLDEETASQRYELFLSPLLDRYLPLWNQVHKGTYIIKSNLMEILTKCLLLIDTSNYQKKLNIPVRTFQKILTKLEAGLSKQRDYVFLTSWKLSVEFIRLLVAHKDVIDVLSTEERNDCYSEKYRAVFEELHSKIAPAFAQYSVGLLKDDLAMLYPSVYILFAQALKEFFEKCLYHVSFQNNDKMEHLKHILLSGKEKEVYLVVYIVLESVLQYINTDEIKKKKDLCEILHSHPSEELKMHFYHLLREKAIFES